MNNSKSELLCDWRFTANRFVLATSPLRLTASNFIFQLNTCCYSPRVTSSLTRGRVCCLYLLLVLASAVILISEFCGTYDHILLSQIRDSSDLEGQVHVLISPKEQCGPVVVPDTGFPFRRLLRLAGLQWRYSNLPPHTWTTSSRYIAPSRTAHKTSVPILRSLVAGEACPQSCSLAMTVLLSPVYTAVTWQRDYVS
jgi:hypothetical protein